jgi:hypothetical protein
MKMTSRLLSVVQILLLACLGIILIPAGAHFFELPNKMALAPADYMITQRIYAGWAWFGFPIFLSMALLAIHAVLVKNARSAMWLSLAAVALIALTQTIFWSFTYPMNELTQNWTVTPANVEEARRQWEYSHAANAVLTFFAFVAACIAVIAARSQRAGRERA